MKVQLKNLDKSWVYLYQFIVLSWTFVQLDNFSLYAAVLIIQQGYLLNYKGRLNLGLNYCLPVFQIHRIKLKQFVKLNEMLVIFRWCGFKTVNFILEVVITLFCESFVWPH